MASRNRGDDWRMAAGWVAALSVHLALLAALIMGQPAPLPAVSAPAAVSLVVLPAVRHRQSAVAPRPPQISAQVSAAPKSVIANAGPSAVAKPMPVRPVSTPKPRANAASAAPPAADNAVALGTPAVDPQNFVAAEPLSGANQPPEYPQTAVDHGEQGRVLLSIHVLPDGLTDFVAVTRSSGYQVLDQAARDAVLKWRFQAATMAGKPVVMVIPFWFNFDLQTGNVRAGVPGGQ